MPKWLFALAAGALVFYTDDYVIAGVLPEIADELAVSAGAAGQLVTVFSVTVAVAAPVAAVVTARARRRAVLAGAAVLFSLANALAAVTPSYEALLFTRIAAALAAAAATPALFSLTAQLAPADKVGRYVAVVAFGVTGAIAFGVPAGTWISGAFGWRTTFGVMAGAGAVVGLGFLTQLPRRAGAVPVTPLRAQAQVLLRPAVSLGLVANVVLMTGSMMVFTYLAPFMAEFGSSQVGERGVWFAVSGVAGMVGLWAGGLATDAWGTDRTLVVGVGGFVATMAVLAVLWLVRPVPVAVVVPVLAVWGAAAFWNSPAVQARLHLLAGPVAAQALALNTSGTYLGVALGGALGGAVIDTAGAALLPVVAGLVGAAALLLFGLAVHRSTVRERAEA